MQKRRCSRWVWIGLAALLVGPLAGSGVALAGGGSSVVGTSAPMAAHAVYFVLTDRFVNGDPSNDQRDQGAPRQRTFDIPTPGGPPGRSDNVGYLGGDFRGLLDNAGYIRELGFGAVWISPIVENPDEPFTGGEPVVWAGKLTDRGKTGYHGYWGTNFYEVDEHWPSHDLGFRELTTGLRGRGLLTVLDIVLNHGTPSFNAPTQRADFGRIFGHDNRLIADHQNLHPSRLRPQSNPLHAFFHDQPDLAQLSNIDENNPAVLEYFVGAYLQWIEHGADAFRIDTIRHMPLPFWKKFSDRIRAEHPGFFMFGEAFDFEARNIAAFTLPENGGFSVLDFPLQQAMSRVFGSENAGFEEIAAALHLVGGPYANPYELMTFYDNHDMARLNATDAGFINAHNLLFTVRGIPVVYYGSEIGFERGTVEHAGNRNYFGQARIDAAAAHPIHQNLKRIARLRKQTVALQRGVQVNLLFEGERAAFYRIHEHGGVAQTALVLLNKDDRAADFTLTEMVQPGTWRAALGGASKHIDAGAAFTTSVPANGVRVYLFERAINAPALRAALAAKPAVSPSH